MAGFGLRLGEYIVVLVCDFIVDRREKESWQWHHQSNNVVVATLI